MCFSPSPPRAAPPPPPPPPPVAAAASVTGDISGDGRSATDRRRGRVQAAGRRQNVLTGPGGVLGEPNIGRRTLLGG